MYVYISQLLRGYDSQLMKIWKNRPSSSLLGGLEKFHYSGCSKSL